MSQKMKESKKEFNSARVICRGGRSEPFRRRIQRPAWFRPRPEPATGPPTPGWLDARLPPANSLQIKNVNVNF
jgi:hypothetical protein